MGNRNSQSSNSVVRGLRAMVDHVVHTVVNIPSHIQTAGRTIYHACGGTSIKLWDVSRDAYYYNKRVRWVNDYLMKTGDHVGAITGIAYDYINSNNNLVLDLNNINRNLRSVTNIRRVVSFLNQIFNERGNWIPTIRDPQGTYHNGYNINKNGMVYDMIADHTKELRSKCDKSTDGIMKESYKNIIRQKLNNGNLTSNQMVTDIRNISSYQNLIDKSVGLSVASQIEHVESVIIYFQTESNYMRGLNENGNPMNDELRKFDYTAYFRKSGITDARASQFLTEFREEHIEAMNTNINDLRQSLRGNINSLDRLARKIEILSNGPVICGSIPTLQDSEVDMLSNNDRLVIKKFAPVAPNQNNNGDNNDDDDIPVAQAVVEQIYTIDIGDFVLQNYNLLVTRLLNSGLTNAGFRMRVVNPPPNAAALGGGTNANHPNQQDIIDLFGTLGGYNGNEFNYNNEVAILIECDHRFVIDGANSSIRSFLGIQPADMESAENIDNIGYIPPVVDNDDPNNNTNGVPPIGPHYMLLGPFVSSAAELNTMVNNIKTDFYTNIVPNILADIWHGLKYEVPVTNNNGNNNGEGN